jgi:chromosomal replication initiator protein
VALLIATYIKTNIRELEGSLTRLLAVASLAMMPPSDINAEFTKEVLKEQIKAPERSIRIEDIQKICADFFRLPLEAIKGKRRTNSIVFPRQVAMYASRKLTDCSLTEIGDKFGHRDHTTVIYACDKIEQMTKSDRNSKETVDKIISLASAQTKA